MRNVDFVRAADSGAKFIAGGTNLVDLMKDEIERPELLVDVNALPLHDISPLPNGSLRLGALATNADGAYDERVRSRYPVLSSAILAGASPQLRNAATNGGNLNQRTRCSELQVAVHREYRGASESSLRTPGFHPFYRWLLL